MKMNLYRNAMVEAVSRLVAIPSVFETDDRTPFGPQVDRCLDEALAILSELGLHTYKSPDGMYGYAEIGEGELFGVLCHLDVVQARQEDGWNYPPFVPTVQDNCLYGRGTQDDKGPTIAAAFALKSLLDDQIPLRKRVRFIFGIDEETLWHSIRAYSQREEAPASGFVPDSAFPLTYAEKGLLQVHIRSAEPFPFSCRGGDTLNAVSSFACCPDKDALRLALDELGLPWHQKGDELCVEGMTAHAKNPWKGKSANLYLLRALRKAGYEHPAVRFACDALDEKFRFEGFTDDDLSDFSGPVTVNLGTMTLNESGCELGLDLRLPVGCTKEKVMDLLRQKAASYGLEVEEFDWLRPLHVPLDTPLVQNLMTAYRTVTGDDVTEPYISAGATFARAFDNCVAFGANLPDCPTSEHQPNEHIDIDKLVLAAEIYRNALKLCVT